MFAGVSTGPCVASMPAAMVGADTTGGVVIGGVACGGNRPRLHRRHCPFRQRMRASRGRLPRHHPGRKRLPNRRRRYALSEGRRRQRPAGHRHRGPVAMTGGVAAAGVVTTGAGGTGPALACRLEAPIARGAGCEQAAWTPLPEKPPAPTDCGDARSPAPSTLPKLPPRAPGPVSAARSFSLIRRGGGASSTLKPLARAHVRGSSPISSASRISCMAVMTLSTASRDAFAASALHLV